MKKIKLLLALLISLLCLNACENVNGEEISATGDDASTLQDESKEVNEKTSAEKLTIDKLEELVNDSGWEDYCKCLSFSDWEKYEYFFDETYDQIHISLNERFVLTICPQDNGIDVDSIWLTNSATEASKCLYCFDGNTPVDTDIEKFINDEYEFPEMIEEIIPQSTQLSSEIKFASGYKELGFLNFDIKFWESNDYVLPKHGEYAMDSWYALGGIGICKEDTESYAIFSDGNLVAYNYIDNHMEAEFIEKIKNNKYSGCLYKYNIDLFTATEGVEGEVSDEDMTIDYYVLFFTPGDDIYMEFFNCDYFSEDEVLATIN